MRPYSEKVRRKPATLLAYRLRQRVERRQVGAKLQTCRYDETVSHANTCSQCMRSPIKRPHSRQLRQLERGSGSGGTIDARLQRQRQRAALNEPIAIGSIFD